MNRLVDPGCQGSRRWGAVAMVIALPLLAAPARADAPAPVPPVVLLALDTSGSMEYALTVVDPNATSDATPSDSQFAYLPSCGGTTDGKSRYVVAQEVLTGSFQNYHCTYNYRTAPPDREDYGYIIPHVEPHGSQAGDGLIDVVGSRFKFGVMTFDVNPGVGTDAEGGYSYGDEPLPNYGAKNEGPGGHGHNALGGRFVPPEPTDVPSAILHVNADVKDSIHGAVPYGGTPLAPFLHDARYFFTHDPSQQAYDSSTGIGDPYLACRTRSVVLVSDGRANLGEGTDAYAVSTEYARQLFQSGIRVYVIGFALPPGVANQMNAIAQAGGTSTAFIADNQAQLISSLSQILGSLETSVQTRTKTVVTDDTQYSAAEPDLQYQFNAGFSMVTSVPGLRQGILEQSVFQCQNHDNAASISSVESLQTKLAAIDDDHRLIYTLIGGALRELRTGGSNFVTPDVLGVPDGAGAVLMDFSRTADGLCGSGILAAHDMVQPDAWTTARQEFTQNVLNFVRAAPDSCRYGFPLGPIIHSTPVIETHLTNIDLAVPSFHNFKFNALTRANQLTGSDMTFRVNCPTATCTNPSVRPTMLFVGSGDGILHAFRVDHASVTDFGKELWGFVPKHLLPRLQVLPFRQETPLVDGAPVLKDILMSRDPQGTTAAPPSAADETALWKTVLVTGYREGGRGYAALDVSNPEAPQFLWELSNTERCLPGEATCRPAIDPDTLQPVFDNDFTRLGWSFSQPELGSVHLLTTGPNGTRSSEVAVAVFGGGSSTPPPGQAAPTDPMTGRTMFVVRLSDGKKLAEFTAPPQVDATCLLTGSTLVDADLVGGVRCYSTFPGSFVTRCFIGDAAGRLWRLDLGSPVPAGGTIGTSDFVYPAWQLDYFYDPYKSTGTTVGSADRAPSYEAPSVSLAPTGGDLVVVYGGSDPDALTEATKKDFVVSLTEKQSSLLQETDLDCNPFLHSTEGCLMHSFAAVLDWKKYFGFNPDLTRVSGALAGERMMGSPTVFSGVVYYTTFTPDLVNSCNPGTGRVCGVDYRQHSRSPNNCSHLVAKLDADGNPATPELVECIDIGPSIPYGVTVATRPACINGVPVGGTSSGGSGGTPLGAGSTPSTPTLIVQTAVQNAVTTDTIPPGTLGAPPQVAKMTRSIVAAVQALFVSAWGFVFD